MAKRPTWKGYVRLSLVTIPVRAYTANSSGRGEIHLHQIHEKCHSRIKYKKVCPIHGEVDSSEIVSGYEFAKGQYVIIDPDELDKLRTESDKAVQIRTFVAPEALDPVYYSGQTYYLAPDGRVGAKPYVLLHEGMERLKRYAVAQVVLRGKEQLVLLRPLGRLLAMTMLDFASQIVKPATIEEEIPSVKASGTEMDLVETLIKAQTEKNFDFEAIQDAYTKKLRQFIEAKVEDKEIVVPEAAADEPSVINLMDALKKSVAQTQGEDAGKAKPPRRMAKSTSRRKRKKKSG